MIAFRRLIIKILIVFVFHLSVIYTGCASSEQLYPIRIGDQLGYVNKAGCVAIEPRFDKAFFFEGSVARVTENGEWGIIDKKGRYIIKPQYVEIGAFKDGLALVKNKSNQGFINNNGKVGFINAKCDIVVPIECESAWEFKNGVASFRKSGKDYFIDKNLVYITEDQFCQRRECYYRTRNIHPFEKDGKWGLISNDENKMILNPTYNHIFDEKEGLFKIGNERGYGFIDRAGNIVIEPQFEFALDFKEGLAAVRKNGKYGFIDKTGRLVIQPRFDQAGDFEDGAAAVYIENKWGLIDKTGRFIFEPQLEPSGIFKNRPISYNCGVWNFCKNGKWGLMDKSGKIIISPQFDNAIGPFTNCDFAQINVNNKTGVINKSGKTIMTPQYLGIIIYPNFGYPDAPEYFEILMGFQHRGYADTSGHFFVITEKISDRFVVKNGKGEITWPKDIKESCYSK